MKIKKHLDKLLNDTETIIIATDTGIAIEGDKVKILFLLEALIKQLKDSGISEKTLRRTMNSALFIKEPEISLVFEHSKEFKNIVKDFIKEIEKDLDLGDDENE